MPRSPSESSPNANPSDHRSSSATLRTLLPASSSHGMSSTSISSVSTSSSPLPLPAVIARKRRPATAAACGACRKRKSKCDGARPRCLVCSDRDTECVYATNAAETHVQALKRRFGELQGRKTAYERIYEILQIRPEADAVEIYRRIRHGADADSVLRHIDYGDVLVQLSLVPEASYRYEFPYVRDMPVALQRPDNPYLDSEVYAMTFASTSASTAASASKSSSSSSSSAPKPEPAATAPLPSSPYSKPYHAAAVADSRMDSAKPSRWTSVSSDDNLMRKLLHAYFLHEYGWFTFFHKELFCQDLVAGRDRFCCDLLVNALLAYSCHCYRGLRDRAEYWNPKNLGYLFLAEAKRLWEINLEQERLPTESEEGWQLRPLKTIQCALVLNVLYILNGVDKIGFRYAVHAVAIAHDIGLFGEPPPSVSDEVAQVRILTAWGLFNWQSLNSYHYLSAPLVKTSPPELPDPVENPHWYGEVWVKYPLDQVLYPTHHALLFKARSDFWAVVNGFSVLYFGRDHRSEFPTAEAVRLYSQLKTWYDGLPEPLSAKRIVTPHQLKLHMHYHLVMINILKPLSQSTQNDGLDGIRPRKALGESRALLETLVRLYYLRHGFEFLDAFLLQFLGALMQMMTARAAQHDDGDNRPLGPWLRSTLLLCAKGIHDQGRSYYLARAVLSVQTRRLPPDDLELLRRFVDIDPDRDRDLAAVLEQPILSDWPTYPEGLDEEPEALRLGVLCRNPALRLASREKPSEAADEPE